MGAEPNQVTVEGACFTDVAVRRSPVLEDGRPVGMVSVGDLEVEREPTSPLADTTAARPND